MGVLLGAGVLVETQALAFAPAAGLALLIAAWRADAGRVRALAAAVGAGAAPLAVYGVLGAAVWNRPLLDRVSDVSATAPASQPWTALGQLSFLWQEYLPGCRS